MNEERIRQVAAKIVRDWQNAQEQELRHIIMFGTSTIEPQGFFKSEVEVIDGVEMIINEENHK